MGYAKGDVVVVRGMGLGKVKRVGTDRSLELFFSDNESDVLELTADEVPKRVRPAVNRATAEKLLQVLSTKEGDPDRRSWGEQYVELQRVLRASDAEPMAEKLQRLYRTPRPLQATVERVIHNYEDMLLPELAQVLGRQVKALRSQLHLGQPAFGSSAPERPELPPAELPKNLPAGWTCLGTFRIHSGKLVAGETVESDIEATFPGRKFHSNLTLKVRNGDWFAMAKKEKWNGVFVHADAVPEFEKRLAKCRELGKVVIEGGVFCVLDQEVRDDGSFQRVQDLARNEPVDGRGFVVTTANDDAQAVHAVYEGSEAVIVAAPYE